MFVVGVGQYLSLTEIQGIASQPYNEYVYLAHSFDDLPYIVDGLVTNICHLKGRWNFLLPNCTGRWDRLKKLNVRLSGPTLTLQNRCTPLFSFVKARFYYRNRFTKMSESL